jgi:hypothetical protein
MLCFIEKQTYCIVAVLMMYALRQHYCWVLSRFTVLHVIALVGVRREQEVKAELEPATTTGNVSWLCSWQSGVADIFHLIESARQK